MATNSKSGGCGGVAVGTVFALIGLFLVYVGVKGAMKDFVSEPWPTVPCDVLKLAIEDNPKSDPAFRPRVSYRYQWEGASYTSGTVWTHKEGEEDYEQLVEALAAFRAGQAAECSVNPDDPSQAALVPRGPQYAGSLAAILFGGTFAAIGIGVATTIVRGKKETKHALSSKSADSKLPFWIGIPFFGLFACVGLTLLVWFSIAMWSKYLSAREWNEAEATVIWSRVKVHEDSDGETYSADIFYRYHFDGTEYRSNSVGLSAGSSSGRRSKQDKVDSLPAGRTITCYVNPENPHQALLERDAGSWMLFSLFPIPFAAIGVGGLWYTFRSRRKDSNRWNHQEELLIRDQVHTSLSGRAEPQDSGGVTFTPRKNRWLSALGAAALASFWNGIVFAIGADAVRSWFTDAPDKGLSLFLIPFVLIGLALIVLFIHQLLRCFSPAPQISLNRRSPMIGSPLVVQWNVRSGHRRMRQFAIYLVASESAEYEKGTTTATDTSVFYELPIVETRSAANTRSGKERVLIPESLLPSWEGEHNAIKWTLRVRGNIPFFPDVNDDYDVNVVPNQR